MSKERFQTLFEGNMRTIMFLSFDPTGLLMDEFTLDLIVL